ncbi:MAG: hypothetical protein IME98_02670 [Proteobacteria bacterium]|nr:hypothetical protein [Pseudomonadota bacterium]
MCSSKILKSGIDVRLDELVLEQLHSPEALKELLKLEKSRKVEEQQRKVEDDSEERLANIEKEAYEKGFQAGEKAGLEVGQEKAGVIIERVQAIYDEITAFKEKYYKDNEAEVLSLIVGASTKVVHEELKVNNDVMVNILTDAVKAVVETEKVQIRLNPEDIEYHREHNPEFLSYLEEAKGFSIFADPDVTRGGALIESNHVEIDARIETALKKIEKAGREALNSAPETT